MLSRVACTLTILGACLACGTARADDLPDDALAILEEMDAEMEAIRQRYQQEIEDRAAKYAERLQALQDEYTRNALLDEAVAIRDKIRTLRDGLIDAQPDPGNLSRFRGQAGVLFFDVTGKDQGGWLWGTDTYTDDSSLAMAAVHAGVLKVGQRGVVKVTIGPGAQNYPATVRHGVTSSNWGWHPGSFRVQPAWGRLPVRGASAETIEDPGSLTQYRGQVGKRLNVRVTGRTTGIAFGTGTYTDDSDVATAAVHSGVLKDGELGTVRVTILEGQQAYEGSIRNGVISHPYPQWVGSYRIEARGR